MRGSGPVPERLDRRPAGFYNRCLGTERKEKDFVIRYKI